MIFNHGAGFFYTRAHILPSIKGLFIQNNYYLYRDLFKNINNYDALQKNTYINYCSIHAVCKQQLLHGGKLR